MRIDDVIWLDDIVAKIQSKHGVETWEVEEVLVRKPEFRRGGKGRRKGEDLYYALGQTPAGDTYSLSSSASAATKRW